ncbi:PTS sugar transporter subunit IIA [bacterium]|jgi:mannitol/fructose-specific phosphotransferase system IIA component (Ntr-type)|nr:PTS sugar transporter subunit IIA [bacterium]
MRIDEIVREDTVILDLKASKRDDAIRQLSKVVAPKTGAISPAELAKGLILREEKGPPTATKSGFAITHCRTDIVDGIFGGAARLLKPVDFHEPGGNLTHLVFLFVDSKERNEDYLRLLSRITRILSKEKVKEKLLSAGTPKEFVSILAEHDI